MSAAPATLERQPESSGAKLEVAPRPKVVRYVIVQASRGWAEPRALYWGFKISECQRVVDRLPSLTPAELKLVAARVDELLGK